VVRRFQQRHVEIPERDVLNRRVVGLAERQGVLRVGDDSFPRLDTTMRAGFAWMVIG
jgi:hypothetical protein